MEYAECEAVVKEFPPFREAMKRRGIDDMDLLMVDPWLVEAFCISYTVLDYICAGFLCLACNFLWTGVLGITAKLMHRTAGLLNH